MKNVSALAAALIAANFLPPSAALADYAEIFSTHPLAEVQFEGLIPSSFPTLIVSFDALRPTTAPLIHPGVPQIHITENLIHPTDQLLLIVN